MRQNIILSKEAAEIQRLHEEYDAIIAEIHNTVENHPITIDEKKQQIYSKFNELERGTIVGKNAQAMIDDWLRKRGVSFSDKNEERAFMRKLKAKRMRA